MSIRRTIVEVDVEGLNVREFCAQHGISTWLFYDLRRRYHAEGDVALEPRSRAPKTVANRTSIEWQERIVVLRKQLVDAGLDAGPATIWFHLRTRHGDPVPSESAIYRTLRDRGFITPQPAKAPKHSYRSFTAERANECWQIDSTKWPLADGTIAEIINVIDDCTRVAVASVAVASCTTAEAWDAICAAAAKWGWPQRVLSDNGAAFKGRPDTGGGGLEPPLAALGIAMGHSRPYHPQTCGKVERFHQTMKKCLRHLGPAATLTDLQHQLDDLVTVYNHHRPHRGLGRRIPAVVFDDTPRSGPSTVALNVPTTVHHSVVKPDGRVDINKRYSITVGAAHTGQPVTIVTTGLKAHLFIQGRLVRDLTLDPTRRNQPLHSRPGRPSVRDVPRHP